VTEITAFHFADGGASHRARSEVVLKPPPMPSAPDLAEYIAERLATHQAAFKKELQLLRNARGDRAVDQALRQIREEELRQAIEARTGTRAPATVGS